jgi:heme-degrading monooxygenase HmoA
MFAYMWEFTVKAENKILFEEFYSPGGRWARLFSKSSGYIKTELFHDSLSTEKYITIDYWASKAEKDDFILKFSDEYKQLDSECTAFTANERYIGEFDILTQQ